MLDYWNDNTWCSDDMDSFVVFEYTEDRDSEMATREGCADWCTGQADFYGANCCGQAFYGHLDGSSFVSYCALYTMEED
jgi:hypothetical protein